MTRIEKLKALDRADVYKADVLAGALIRDGSDVVFRYNSSYAANAELPAVAWSIPKALGEIRASAGSLPPFFAGLLPEGVRLQGAVAATKTSIDDHLTILLAVGADAIGDVQVVPAGEEPAHAAPAFDPDHVGTSDLREIFERVAGAETIDMDPAALPGVQAKVSAEMYSTPIATRKGPAILKLAPDRGFPQLVENEHFFMDLAASCGLTAARQTLIHDRSGRAGLLVSRFDRANDAQGNSVRLPQEDACQVLNVYPAAKYRLKTEEVIRSLAHVCELGRGSARLASLELMRLVAYSYAIGNGDLHGKNFSVFTGTAGFWTATPAYDLLCTQPYVGWRDPMALDLYGRANRLSRKHFLEAGERLSIPSRAVGKMLDQVCTGIERGAAGVDAISFDDRTTELLSAMLTRRVKELR